MIHSFSNSDEYQSLLFAEIKSLIFNEIKFELCWKNSPYNLGPALDLDISAFLLSNKSGEPICPNSGSLVFYNNKTVSGVSHFRIPKPNRDSFDKEVLTINFSNITQSAKIIDEISVVVTIDRAKGYSVTFSNFNEATLKMIGCGKIGSGQFEPLMELDLSKSFPNAMSIQVGSFVKNANLQWEYVSVETGFKKDLADICKEYGLKT